ncbi:Ca-activated chloride channel family protein [Amaricoccus macauensis]|uniref:Ca-activated chloride channel family protein n=1 Tax=Amaricoccus macauensis TaxID=57001 RepID=A0A840SKI7_9RHOB|nr:VWA domain-containing protein [Amaricoccus macauensis]MBB5223639.1 Ca-activated chloride channel family protein [Amaricoccus macauensis]
MIAWGDLALLRPWWLLALPVVFAAARLAERRSTTPAGWGAAMDPVLLQAMARLGRVLPGARRAGYLPAAILATLALALAGPALRDRSAPTFRNLDGLFIVFDVSSSMTMGGALPAAEDAARLIVSAASSRPAGLIVYAGDAYLGSALSTDGDVLGPMIAALDGETVPDPGSCLACGLNLAGRLLAESGTLKSDVVVVSDGGGAAEALPAVEALVAAGARVSTLAVAPIEHPSDLPPGDPAGLAAIARAGRGVAASLDDPQPLLAAVRSGGGRVTVPAALRHLGWHDYGRLLAVVPLLLAFGLFRRSA